MSFSQHILDLQKQLNASGFLPQSITEDGLNGPQTSAAVCFVQRAVGIDVDGVVGKRTQTVLDNPSKYPKCVLYGIDTLQEVTTQLYRDAIMNLTQAGLNPRIAFWARYTNGLKQSEIEILANRKVPILPIARQSGLVAGDRACGQRSAVAELTRLRNLDGRVSRYVFLDVEGEPDLTPEFWGAWSLEIRAAGWVPCAYMPNATNFPESWSALVAGYCAFTWVAGYCQPSNGKAHACQAHWGGPLVQTPYGSPPVFAWQHVGNADDKKFDFNALNPNVSVPWVTL
jgi:hypothetical protein